MYRMIKHIIAGKEEISVQYSKDNNEYVSFPAIADNPFYIKFKSDVLAGAELQDADGNVMTQEQANEFIGSLP